MDVWRIDLDRSCALNGLLAILDEQEKRRAASFLSDSLARRFIVAHAATRCILSTYNGLPPEDLKFEYNIYGKPALANNGGPPFNLSHSHDLALCAVARSGELGVDIERRRDIDYLEMASRFFSSTETKCLLGLNDELSRHVFFVCWTRKEAYIKAKGLGLSLPLEQFSVEMRPGIPARLIECAYAPEDVDRFRLWDVPVPEGYMAAAAHSGVDEGAPNYWLWNFGESLMAS
jgi:4'-phosphopantetheinyl transferase